MAPDAVACPHCGATSPGTPTTSPPGRKWLKASGLFLLKALAQSILVGGVLLYLFQQTVQPGIDRLLAPPDCNNPKDLDKIEPWYTTATSTLPGQSRTASFAEPSGLVTERNLGFDYSSLRLVDGDTGTAWSEDASGLGHGESVTLRFSNVPVTVDLLCIVNGFAFSQELYAKNGRVRTLILTAGDREKRVTLADIGVSDGVVFQPITVGWDNVGWLTMTISSTYAGLGDRRDPDTLISEVEVWGRHG